MLDIPKEFFEEETRDGYVVSEMMKRCWAAQLGILDSLKKIFDKYGLRYFADYGTLLGAVRHKGYIPWDDDLDIAMPRKDLMTLLQHADELDDGLVIRSVYNSETYMNFNVVVTQKADTLKWDDERMEKYHGCPFICYVDIFPWDYVPRDEEKIKLQSAMYGKAFKLMYDLRNIEAVLFGGRTVTLRELNRHDVQKYQAVQDMVRGCKELGEMLGDNLPGVKLDPDKKLRQQLCISADTIAQMCPEEDADYVDYFVIFSGGVPVKPRKKKEWQESSVELPFEFGTISAPTEYLKDLETKYGKEYMKPVRFLSAHGYPFYRDEIRVLIGGDTGEMLTDEPLSDPSVESIPEEVRALLLKEDGSLKRIILYGLSATDIVNNGTAGLGRIMSQLEEKTQEEDVIVFVFVPASLRAFMDRCKLGMYENYLEMLDKIGGMEKVILDEAPETAMLWTLISICDVYFGDRCRLEEICRKYDVPITIQDYQPIN